jgi:hypothetical protein
MWVLIGFVIFHVYAAIREDIMDRQIISARSSPAAARSRTDAMTLRARLTIGSHARGQR